MRIALLTFCLILAGCAATDQPSSRGNQAGDLNAANAVCLKRGLKPGTYNYSSCYQNRPEVQAYERNSRLSNNAIILKNRSVYSSYRGRSYPVE
ncbi:MAG TPA: hypothetical protein VIN59_08610 [Alphaproteobacteria bacterium]